MGMPLQRQPMGIRLSKLDTSADPKSSVPGTLELLENAMANRHSDQGFELAKRYGLVHLSRTIDGGGSLSVGAKIAALGTELLATDGGFLYTWAVALSKWVKKGKITDLAATVTPISGAPAALAFPNLDCDVAYANGYLCFTCSGAFSTDNSSTWFMQEVATGAVIASGHLGAAGTARKLRVVVVGTVFFLFYWDGTNTLICRKIDTATPTTISAASNVAVNLNTTGLYDVIADVTNSRMVVCYRNTTPTTTLGIWNTNMTAGTTVAYATRDPNTAIGFLDYSFASGSGFVAIGTSATGVRLLTFGSSSMTVTIDTVVDGAVVTAVLACGYVSAVANVFYSTGTHIQGWSNGTPYMVQRGAEPASRVISMNGKRYMLASYRGASASLQQSLFLIELEVDTAGAAAGAMVAGHLVQGNAASRLSVKSLGALVAVSSTVAVAAHSIIEARQAPTLSISVEHSTLSRITLDWSGTLTGAPVAFNQLLYFPGAASKQYDGRDLQEVGFYVYPEAPTLTPTVILAATPGTYKYCLVYSKLDNAGKVHRSAPSPISSITVGATQGRVTIVGAYLRLTDTDPAHNTNPLMSPVNVEIYRTDPNGAIFSLYRVLVNDPTTDTFSLDDEGLTAGFLGEPLYTTTGAAGHVLPAAVLTFEAHRDRLFALASDVVYPSTDVASGDAVAFAADTDGFFLEFDTAKAGPLVGMVTDGTTLHIASRSRVYPLMGDGPDFAGNNGYAFPLPLPPELGLLGPRAFVATPDGIIIQTAQGKHILAGGAITPMPGSDAYDSLTVTGGVVLDDRSMACMTTSDGTTLVWDWLYKQWYVWTNHAAVASCRWQNKLVLLASDGTAKVDTAGTYSDNGSAIQMKIRTGWLQLAGMFGRMRLYALRVLVEFMATCTLTVKASVEIYGAQVDETTAFAGTTATKFPLAVPMTQERCEALKVEITESSTTQGVIVSAVGMEVGLKAGAGKMPPGQFTS